LKDHGAKRVYAFITHGIFSGPAADRIKKSELEAIVCSDSIKLSPEVQHKMEGKLHYASLDLFLAEIIRRSVNGESTIPLTKDPHYK
jgi:ribose-phosphate pyrophosphokinase